MKIVFSNLHLQSCRILLSLIFYCSFIFTANAEIRIKDIVYFEGIRDNMLIGYGLVVGLNGTGDNLKNSSFTEKGLTDFLEKLGINTRGSSLKTKNIAAVTITATLPPFARTGTRISIDVNTIGDAKSLKGGTLLATPLLGADGEVYALAQGPISIGTKPDDDPSKPAINIPTSGYIANGGIVEKEIGFDLNQLDTINLALKNPDISTARAIENVINSTMRSKLAIAKDPGTVKLEIPEKYIDNVVSLLADIENLSIQPDNVAKIIIDEATGTIVIGDNVTISKVAIAQGNLTIKVSEEKEFLFNIGAVGATPKPTEPGSEIAVFNEATKLSDVVEGLNSLGVKPKDLVAILKTIKLSGALQAEIEVR
jgi:flagellar P-ring protein precursor FlgI